MTWTTLVQAEALVAAQLKAAVAREPDGDANVHAPMVIFDCRFSLADPHQGEAAWRASHLPGAQYAHLERDLSDMRTPHAPGSGRHPWPQAAKVAAWLRACGVTTQTQVVAYDAGDGAFAARLWCVLRMLGHRKVAVLDGGWTRWQALGLPTDTAATSPMMVAGTAHANQRSDIDRAANSDGTPDFDRTRLLDATAVQQHLAAGGVLLDARAAERFRGDVEPIDPVAGHVPGAINRPYSENLRDGRFKPAAELAEEFSALLGARAGGDVVAMCGSGVTACHHLLAMAYAGLGDPKLFMGSWSGWIEDATRPVATGEASFMQKDNDMKIEIWHNPACGTSRNTLALIRHVGIEPVVIEYLKTPPNKQTLAATIAAAGLSVREAIREKGTPYLELGLDDDSLGDDALLDAMLAHPVLINRPFVMTPMGVRLCRPSEVVLDILPPCDTPFTKEDGEVVIDANGVRMR